MRGHLFHPSIIREYDIRGVYGETLKEADALAIGHAMALIAKDRLGVESPHFVSGRDGRLSAPSLQNALIDGLQKGGARVTNIGLGPTPMTYFAAQHLQADGAVMVTGSHNPPSHNGFKCVLGGQSFFGEDLQALAAFCAEGLDEEASPIAVQTADIREIYANALIAASRLPQLPPVKAVLDAGNGAGGEIARLLVEKLRAYGHQIELLYAEIDGHFPHHHPDPSDAKNMVDLQQAVQRHQANVGLALDGDADRLGVVAENGDLVLPDHLLMLLIAQTLAEKPASTIIADVKSSQSVFDYAESLGGISLMWKTGHSHIKRKMKETGAAFAGEASGHLFFADRYFGYDDGLYAALRMMEITAGLAQPLSQHIATLPHPVTTPECRIDCPDERKFNVIEEIRQRLDRLGTEYNAIDGVRVSRPEGWWLVRASNTQGALIARAEAADASGLEPLVIEMREELAQSGVVLPL